VQEGAHLPSQVTSTRMSLCVDFRWRFFELSWSVVLVNCRQLLEDEAMALVFSRIAVRERERRFCISLPRPSQSDWSNFNRFSRRSVPCGTSKR